MEGKIFFALFGLGLVQVLASFYMALVTPSYVLAFEVLIALTFMAGIAHYLYSSLTRLHPETAFLVIVFAIGFLNVVYLSFHITTVWLVLMISLDAAGFILSLDQLTPRKIGTYVLRYPPHPSVSALQK